MKNTASKTGTQKKIKPPPRKAPSKASSAVISSSTTRRKWTQGENSESPCEKRSRTRPLTAADIPDIVSAEAMAMPQPTVTSATPTPRRTPSCRKKNTEQQRTSLEEPLASELRTQQLLLKQTTAVMTRTRTTRILSNYTYSVWFPFGFFFTILFHITCIMQMAYLRTTHKPMLYIEACTQASLSCHAKLSQGLKAHCLLCPTVLYLAEEPPDDPTLSAYNNWNLIQQMFQALTVAT